MGMIGNAPVAGTIGTGNIQDGGVETADIKDGAVVNAKLGSDLDASKLTAGTLPIARVADGAVTAAKLASTAVTDKLGYTPANKAGDTFTGNTSIGGWTRAYGQVPVDSDTTAGVFLGTGNGGDGTNPRINLNTGNASQLVQIDNSSGTFRVFKPGTVFLSINQNGRVSMPLQPAFLATDQNVTFTPDSSSAQYGTVRLNRGNGYVGSTKTFTVPAGAAGVYYFTHKASARSTSNVTYEAKISVNGVEKARSFSNGATFAHNNTAVLLAELQVGDTVTATFYNGGSVVMSGSDDITSSSSGIVSGFMGYYLG